MKRIPRKLKKKIPRGMYCYTYKRPIYKNGNWAGYEIEPCPKYTWKDIVDDEGETDTVEWCKLFNCELLDQCKSCSIKLDWK